ncbi:hypothetical protein EV700_1763 [Fluviicoccus keumensis]|uniref:Cold shock CspA family protein n=1 Tax=Fluviicoccus keumensis TaxID=1435465 RepID=A0A4Q7Z5M6_9GAMM|nr:hypothetical protein [Fluviicoccus keumensis]RZU44959.1 hypothetical protein EV700_1763 [Fluviicoccus keumensis]
MKMEGTLSQWDSRSGTGIITPVHGHHTFTVTRADFPKGMNPRLGEELLFETATGPDGLPCAKSVTRPEHATPPVLDVFAGQLPPPLAKQKRTGIPAIIVISIVAAFGFYLFAHKDPEPAPAVSDLRGTEISTVDQWKEKIRLLLKKLLASDAKTDHKDTAP